MPNRLRKLSMSLAMPGLLLASGNALSEYALNLPEPVSPVTKEVFDLHMMTAYIALIIMILVTGGHRLLHFQVQKIQEL